ncbi:hypothetical protein [Leptothoe spongobia]|uniref:Uncharacterized protein n=1 Tax=Leptothoe spongobia TAU-MAC 1115 TaxID=1967444 RepID=A0A947DDN2_9CYAN|nr:hypothetical protein [Leptothoe spongobia]MBT9314644.1 hypothetical protein [Leptothoe spongobia TAU-MAC 1115]
MDFLAAGQKQGLHGSHWYTPMKKLVQDYLNDNDLTPELHAAVESTCDNLAQGYESDRKTANQLRMLISAETKTLKFQASVPGV